MPAVHTRPAADALPRQSADRDRADRDRAGRNRSEGNRPEGNRSEGNRSEGNRSEGNRSDLLALEVQNAELRETRDLLERALDDHADLYQSSPVGYVQFDGQGVVCDLNRRAAGLVGTACERAVGLPFVHFVAEPDHREFHRHLRRCRESAGTVRSELRLAVVDRGGRDDGERTVQFLTRRLRHGRETYQTALVDVSEVHAAEGKLRRAHAELLVRTEEAESRSAMLRRLHARVTKAEQAERDRLARHLHDHLQQFLVGAKMQAHVAGQNVAEGAADPAELAETLGRVAELVDEALTCSRTLTSELSPPPVLHTLGIAAALHWLADFYERRHALAVTIDAGEDDPGGGELPDLPEDLRVLLFEATRELLFNVVKYAGVRRAAIRLRAVGGGAAGGRFVELTVADEGEGFETADRLVKQRDATGLGLFGLAERLEDVGGSVQITSAPGRGASVAVAVPAE